VGALARRKGAAGEQALVRALRAAGLAAVRVSPLEAGTPARGDVRDADVTWSVKRRRRIGLYAWLGEADALALRADRQRWLVVIPLDAYLRLRTASRGGDST
jgi:hypothetical protein